MNLQTTNLYLIIWLLNTVTENVAFITQPDHKDNPGPLKSLQSVGEAASDVTLNLIKSLCSCLREKLKKQKTFNGETNLLLTEDEADQESDIDFYKSMYNRTCADLRQTSQDINGEIVNDNKDAVLNKDHQDDADSLKQYHNSTGQPKKKEYRLLYHALIKGINNHTYKIQKYPLYKHNVTFNGEDIRSVIVIITLLPLLNNSTLQQSFYSLTENEIDQTLNTNSLVDIHIIDSMFTNKYEKISPVKKCHLYSLYIFIIESGKKNSIKNFKLLRVKRTIKMYIDVLSNLNLENFPDQCCNKSLLTLCKNRINSEKNEFTDKEQIKYKAPQQNDTDLKNIISKIKKLINLYNAKIIQEDNPNEILLSKNCNESQYFYEKTNASTTTLLNIDTGIPSVPQNYTTQNYSETTKGLDLREHFLPINTSFQNTTVIKGEKTHTTTITTRSEEKNIKPNIVQNIERNVIAGKNSRKLFAEKTFLRNQTIDLKRIQNKNIMNVSVEPIQITQSVYYERHTTIVPQGSEKNLNMFIVQKFPTVIPTLSTAIYNINDNTLKTETINTMGNTSINFPNTIRETYQEENIKPKAKTNKWSNFTLFTMGDNLTEILTNKISRATRTIDLSVTRKENRSRILADLENHTTAVTLSRAINTITKIPQNKYIKQEIMENATRKLILEANTLLTNQKINLSTVKYNSKIGIDLSVLPIQNELPEEPLPREAEVKLQNLQKFDTEKSILLTKSHMTTEKHKRQATNISKPSSTTPMNKNKQITVPNPTIGYRLQEEIIKPTIVENAISISIQEDNLTEVLTENTILTNQTSPLFITKNAYKTSNFVITPALDVVQPVQVSAKHYETRQHNKMLGPTHINNQVLTLSSKIPTQLQKYELNETVLTSYVPNQIDIYSQKNWLHPSNRTVLKLTNLSNISDSETTNNFLTTQMIPSQSVLQNLSISTTNFSALHVPVVRENYVMNNSFYNLVINTPYFLNTSKVKHLNTLLNTINFKEDVRNDYMVTSTEPLRTTVYNRASLPSPLTEFLTDSNTGNQIKSSTRQSLSNNSGIFNMDKTQKQMEENVDDKKNHLLKDKHRLIYINNSSTSTKISYLVTVTNKPLSPQSDTNTIYPLSALTSTTPVLNKMHSNHSYPYISKNEYLQQKNTFDIQEEVTQILSHNKKISQTIVPTDSLLSKTITPKLITDKNRLDQTNVHLINQSKAETFSNKLISNKIKHQPRTYIVKPKYNILTTLVPQYKTQKVNNNLNKPTSKDWFIKNKFYLTKKPTIIKRQDKNYTVHIIENLVNNSKFILFTTPGHPSNRNDTLSGPINTEVHNNTNKIRIDLSVTPLQSRVFIDLKKRANMTSQPRATNKNLQNITTDTPTLSTSYYNRNEKKLRSRKFTMRNNLKKNFTENTFSMNQTIDLSIIKKNYNKSNLIQINNYAISPTTVTTVQILVKDTDIKKPTLDPNNYVSLTNENSISQNLYKVTPYITNVKNKNDTKRNKIIISDEIKKQKQFTDYSPGSYYHHAPYTQINSLTQGSLFGMVRNTKYKSMLRDPSQKNVEGEGKGPQNDQKLKTEISNAAVRNKSHILKMLTQNLSSTPTQTIHNVFSPHGRYFRTNLFKTTLSGQNFAASSEVIDIKSQDTHVAPTPSSKMSKYQQGYLLHVNKFQPILTTYNSTNNNTIVNNIVPRTNTSTTKKHYATPYITQKKGYVSEKRQVPTIKINNIRNKIRASFAYKSTEKCSKNITEDDNNTMKIFSDKDENKATTTITPYQTIKFYGMNTTQKDKLHYTTLNNQQSFDILSEYKYPKTNYRVTTKKLLPLHIKDSEVNLTTFVNPLKLELLPPTSVSLKIVPYTKKPIFSKSIFDKDAKRDVTTAFTQLKIPFNKKLKRNSKEQQIEIKQEIIPILHEEPTFSSKINKVEKIQPLDKQKFFTPSAAFRLTNISTENITGTAKSSQKQSKFLNACGLETPFIMHYKSTTLNEKFQNQLIYKSSFKENMKIYNTSSKRFHNLVITSTHSSTKAHNIKNISQIIYEIHPIFSTLYNEVNKARHAEAMDIHKTITQSPTSDVPKIGKQASLKSFNLLFNKTKSKKFNVSSKIISFPLFMSTPDPLEKKHSGMKDNISRSIIDEITKKNCTFTSNRTPTESLTTLKDDNFTKTVNVKLGGKFTYFKPKVIISLNNDISFTKPELKMTSVIGTNLYINFLNKKPLDRVSQYKLKNTTDLTNLLNKTSSENKITSLPKDKRSITTPISTKFLPTAALTKLTATESNNIRGRSAIFTTTTTLKQQHLTNKSLKRTPRILTNMNVSSITLTNLYTATLVTQAQNLPQKKHMPRFNKLSTESFMSKQSQSSTTHRNLLALQQSTHFHYDQNNTSQQEDRILKHNLQTRKNLNVSIGLSSAIKQKESSNLFNIPSLTENMSVPTLMASFHSAPLRMKNGMRNFSVLYIPTDYKITLPSNIQFNKKSQEATELIITTTPLSRISTSLYSVRTSDPFKEINIVHESSSKNTFRRDKAQLITPSIVTSSINAISDSSTVESLSIMHENLIQMKNSFSKNTLNSSRSKNIINIMNNNIKTNRNLQKNFTIADVVLNISVISIKPTKNNDILSSTITINPNKYKTLSTKAISISRASISTTYNGNKTSKITKNFMAPKTISASNLISDKHNLFFVESNNTSKRILKSTTPTNLKIQSVRINKNITTKDIYLPQNTSYSFIKNQKLLKYNNKNHTKISSETTQKETNTEFDSNVITESLMVNKYAESTQLPNIDSMHYAHSHNCKHNSTTKYETYIMDPLQAPNEQDLTKKKNTHIKENKNYIATLENKIDTDKTLKSNEIYKPKKKELNITRLSELNVSTAKIISAFSRKFSTTLVPITRQVNLLTNNQSIPKFIDTTKKIFSNTKQIIRKYTTSVTKRDYENKANKFIVETNNTTPCGINLKRLNHIYFTSLPKRMNVLLDINKKYNTKQKKSKEKIKVTDLSTTTPVIENIISQTASPRINSNIMKFHQMINLNTSTGEIPKIFVGFNLTVDFVENKINQNYDSTKMFEYLTTSKNNQGSYYREQSKTVAVTPVILTKSLESSTRLKRKRKTIRYNTYRSIDDLEITLKPHIISKYKLVKSNKSNNLITLLSRNKLRKTSHVLEKKNDILPTFKKTNPTRLAKYPSKPHRKVMKRIRLPNKDKEIIAMDTKDFFAHRKLSVKSNFKEILHKAPINHRTQKIVTVKTKHHVIRPILEKVDGIIKSSRELYKPKPLFFTNNYDFYRKDFITHHQNEALSLREKVNYIKSFPISNPNTPAETVIDIPMYLPPANRKPKVLRDRIDYIRNYLYNTELIKQTQLPMKTFVESTTKDDEAYRDPLYYFRKSGWYEDSFDDRTPTITTARRPTKRQRRTIFFLSPTVPYNHYF